MTNPNEGVHVPLLSPEENGNAPDYQYTPPPSTNQPPPRPPQYQAGNGHYGQYPYTYHPQYGGDQQEQHTNVIVHQQPPTAVSTIYAQRLYTREEYNRRITLLFISSAIAFFFCWPFALVACILSCVAVGNLNEDKNPRPMMTAAFIFIILSFVVGIPLGIVVIVLRS